MIKNGRLYFDPKKNSLANWLTSVICGNKGGISLKKFNRIMSIEECEKYLQKQIDKYNEYVENGWHEYIKPPIELLYPYQILDKLNRLTGWYWEMSIHSRVFVFTCKEKPGLHGIAQLNLIFGLNMNVNISEEKLWISDELGDKARKR